MEGNTAIGPLGVEGNTAIGSFGAEGTTAIGSLGVEGNTARKKDVAKNWHASRAIFPLFRREVPGLHICSGYATEFNTIYKSKFKHSLSLIDNIELSISIKCDNLEACLSQKKLFFII